MPSPRLTRTINGLALAISAAIMVALPLGHWLIAHESMLVGMKQEANIDAFLVSSLINRNPEFWQFEEHRLAEFVTTDIDHADVPERRSILDGDSKLIVQNQIDLPPPLVTRSATLFDSGRPVGRFEISRSLRPLILETALMAMLGLALAAAVFATLRFLPLRALSRAWVELGLERERLRTIVDNAIDGIITFDAETLRVTSLNPAAATIFGYTPKEAADLEIHALIPILETPAEIRRTETSGLIKEGKQVALELSVSKAKAGNETTYVATVHDLTARKEVEAAAAFLSNYDRLTGLPNRSLFRDRLHQAMQRAQRNRQLVGLMVLDIDNFKAINDSLGHAVGDNLLQQAAQRLEQLLRRTDSVCREVGETWSHVEDHGTTLSREGGDEFSVILEGIARPESFATIARKVLESFSVPFTVEGQDVFLTISIGIAIYPTDNLNSDGLIRCADSAMYRAKEQGRGGFEFYTEDMNTRSGERLALEAALRHALTREEFVLHYQPKVDVASGRVVGMEALLRWQSPERGLVPPLEFIPLLEETGQIVPVGEWVLRAACNQIGAWQRAGMPPLQVAVNISARQFKQQGLADTVSRILAETGVSPHHLELELTESMLMERLDASVALMHQLTELGVHISIDDFGTGYSSLGYLKRFPIQKLKIDRSFVRDVTTDQNDAAIASAVIALAHSLQLKVVAEGVENEDQLAFLRERQCDQIQGYFYSRPLPADAFEQWVKARIPT